GLAAPWFVAVAVLEPGFVGSFFWTQNVVRFVAPFDHAKPFWFHLPGLLLGLLPWTLLLPGLVRWLLLSPGTEAARERPAALGLFLLASLWGLVFFSLAGSKRAAYVLPLLPPLALAGGCYLARCLARSERLTRAAWGACAAARFLGLLGGGGCVLPLVRPPVLAARPGAPAGRLVCRLSGPGGLLPASLGLGRLLPGVRRRGGLHRGPDRRAGERAAGSGADGRRGEVRTGPRRLPRGAAGVAGIRAARPPGPRHGGEGAAPHPRRGTALGGDPALRGQRLNSH